VNLETSGTKRNTAATFKEKVEKRINEPERDGEMNGYVCRAGFSPKQQPNQGGMDEMHHKIDTGITKCLSVEGNNLNLNIPAIQMFVRVCRQQAKKVSLTDPHSFC
jgi:hypothetical protein